MRAGVPVVSGDKPGPETDRASFASLVPNAPYRHLTGLPACVASLSVPLALVSSDALAPCAEAGSYNLIYPIGLWLCVPEVKCCRRSRPKIHHPLSVHFPGVYVVLVLADTDTLVRIWKEKYDPGKGKHSKK